ncbi:MAG: hypothetical protein HFE47_00770 [Clostridia bacterium]|nr:hypothetical protein [Clostridia bacterium]
MINNQNNKEKENFNAFIDMMAQLIQKYGQSVLKDATTEMEEADEQRR